MRPSRLPFTRQPMWLPNYPAASVTTPLNGATLTPFSSVTAWAPMAHPAGWAFTINAVSMLTLLYLIGVRMMALSLVNASVKARPRSRVALTWSIALLTSFLYRPHSAAGLPHPLSRS